MFQRVEETNIQTNFSTYNITRTSNTYHGKRRIHIELIPDHMAEEAAQPQAAAHDDQPHSAQPPAGLFGEVVRAVERAVRAELVELRFSDGPEIFVQTHVVVYGLVCF